MSVKIICFEAFWVLLFSFFGSLSAELQVISYQVDSSKIVSNSASPSSFEGIGVGSGKIATLSRINNQTFLNVIDRQGNTLLTAPCDSNTKFPQLISNGTRVLITTCINERRFLNEVYDIASQSKILCFETRRPIVAESDWNFFASAFDVVEPNYPTIYSQDGKELGDIPHRSWVWDITRIDDTTILFLDGNTLEFISYPGLKVLKAINVQGMEEPDFEVKLAVSPDKSMATANISYCMTVIELSSGKQWVIRKQRSTTLTRPIISQLGQSIICFDTDTSGPVLDIYKKVDTGYIIATKSMHLPFGAVNMPFYPRYDVEGSSVTVYYHYQTQSSLLRFTSALIQIPDSTMLNGMILGANGVIFPLQSASAISFNLFRFAEPDANSIELEYINVGISK
ncbi:MAG: hypothetical protein NT002_01080 [candidate division Zixibacteria bacterium]|nr:hypothetical protein [candidate division Zixibacteria bacterium]